MPTLDELFAKIAAKRPPAPTGPVEWLIVGLGNPGAKYDGTRHNMGFAALDALSLDLGVQVDRLKFQSLCGDAVIAGKRALLMKPSTFMNLSGQAVQEAVNFYKIPMDHVLVFCDDVSLPVGRLRIRLKGSDGGHNGLKNIIYLTGSDAFPRVRIGVGDKPHPDYEMADWVLGRFGEEDRKVLMELLKGIPDLCRLMVSGEAQKAMTQYNPGPKPSKAVEPPSEGTAPIPEEGGKGHDRIS